MNFRIKIITKGLILLLCLPFTAIHPDGGYGQTSVKTWADDRLSAFSFTFDDGNISQYTYAVPVLDSFGFKGTFCVISGSNFLTDSLPGDLRYGTWEQFRSISLEGHEIGSHTVTHPALDTLPIGDISTPGTLLYELYQSKNTIEQKIPNQKCITIAYPYVAYNLDVLNATALFYESGRGSATVPNGSSLSGLQYYTIYGNLEHFNLPRDSTQDDLDELQDFENYVQGAITNGEWGALEGHEVFPFSQIPYMLQQGAYYPISTEWLTSLCQWLKQKSDSNLVWVETQGNITRYMRERQEFQYYITSQTTTQIKINASDTLNNQIYNYPLTVDITVPPDWQWTIATQGSRTDTIKTIIVGDSAYVRTNVIPDGDTLILNKLIAPLPVLTLTALIEGLYNDTLMLQDTVTVELHNSTSPFELVDSQKGVLDSVGVGTFTFTIAVNDTPYYLAVKHRNSVETWSSEVHTFTSYALSYDFTNSQNQAYGNNLKLKGGKYCIYTGDVNQDGFVTGEDFTGIDNDASNFVYHLVNDLNGDGFVTGYDFTCIDNNSASFIQQKVPLTETPAVKLIEIKNINNK
jgi:peptidoglycan/xylan/chitin deacetylase (PgdA/CDA1 family)